MIAAGATAPGILYLFLIAAGLIVAAVGVVEWVRARRRRRAVFDVKWRQFVDELRANGLTGGVEWDKR